jgi:hypothetical protein
VPVQEEEEEEGEKEEEIIYTSSAFNSCNKTPNNSDSRCRV